MNLFDRQTAKRYQSFALLIVFLLAMVGLAGLIHVMVAVFAGAMGHGSGLFQLQAPALALIAIIWFAIFAGAAFRLMDVRAGGAVLAERFGAVHAFTDDRHGSEKQLINVVAEMSIAAGVSQPEVYVLRHESSINAFVLGNSEGQPVLVITQGALDTFDRDELKAVVAHEFGHIRNGDLPINMHLLIALGGLLAVDEVGRLLIGTDPRNTMHPGVLVGYLLRVPGAVGVMMASLIRAAFSRQREYLADASAVQFTRHPAALASALSVLQMHEAEPALHGVYAEELAHLCFQNGGKRRWYQKLLRTHPPLQKRIRAIDPHFRLEQRKRKNKESDSQSNSWNNVLAEQQSIITLGSQQCSAANDFIHDANINSTGLSDRVFLMLPDAVSCLPVLFAAFAGSEQTRANNFISAIALSGEKQFAVSVKKILTQFAEELANERQLLLDHVCQVVRDGMPLDERKLLLGRLEGLIRSTGEYSLINYATFQLIRRKLGVETLSAQKKQASWQSCKTHSPGRSFAEMGAEFALLLSLVIESSGAPLIQVEADFKRILKFYTQTDFSLRKANEAGIVEDLEAAFQTLYAQPLAVRQAFMQHCAEIVVSDGRTTAKEKMLLELLADSLGCKSFSHAV